MTQDDIELFHDEVKLMLADLGATDAPPHLSQFQLNTKYGILWISLQNSLIACAFEDVEKAKTANLGMRLNPYSGKWNWHEGPDGLNDFARALDALMEHRYDKAALCVQAVMRKSLALDLTTEQAVTLWLECRALMHPTGLISSIFEIESANDGNLDTLIRGDLHDAIARVLTGMYWPGAGLPGSDDETFTQKVVEQSIAREYKLAE